MRFLFLLAASLLSFCLFSQPSGEASVSLLVVDEKGDSLSNITVELYHADTRVLRKSGITEPSGKIRFTALRPGRYYYQLSRVGYTTFKSEAFSLEAAQTLELPATKLQPAADMLGNVTVEARKPFIQVQPGKTVVNLESSLSSVGTTALEALEKLPGVTVDKDGNISIKGRSGVTVMIDGRLTYLSGPELATMLSAMNSSQISEIEIIDQPTSQYDASGNAGMLNIKTKKLKQRGFNGTVVTNYSQGRYPKPNTSAQVNYKNGKWNLFANYGFAFNQGFTRIYALRTYYQPNNQTITAFLEQPTFMKSEYTGNNVRMGADYAINDKISVGVMVSGSISLRTTRATNSAYWLTSSRAIDSVLQTITGNDNDWKNGSLNVNLKHQISKASVINVDVDLLGYNIKGSQYFENSRVFPDKTHEYSQARFPSKMNIVSAKADYTRDVKDWHLSSGWKTSHIITDNLSEYEILENGSWKHDLGKDNHFLYNETIHAVYGYAERRKKDINWQGGLRYEMTHYDARQLGNVLVKDSSFSRNYNSLFPTAMAGIRIDSNNTITFRAGRRIDRPPFQRFNPFLFIINKYTYQQGNAYIRPQFTWNFGIDHQFKEWLTTGVSYSITKDLIAQVFPVGPNGIIIYSYGNLESQKTIGLSLGVQRSITSWWTLSTQANYIYKFLEGDVDGVNYDSEISQFNLNANNQLRFKKGWAGEVSGFYSSRGRNDIQEIVDPAGQLTAGVARSFFNNRVSAKLLVRDIFYTNWMKGLSYFKQSTEYFKLTRDTRVISFSVTYRFGKSFKTIKRSEGAAEEIQRAGNG